MDRLTIALVILALVAIGFGIWRAVVAANRIHEERWLAGMGAKASAYDGRDQLADAYGDVPAVPRRLLRSSQHSRKV